MATSRCNTDWGTLWALCLCALVLLPVQAPEPDWSAIRDETLTHFTRVLRMDTSNPPGNETQVAEYVKSVFEKDRIPVQLFAKDPTRANVVARLKRSEERRVGKECRSRCSP